jgi:hypothetical protein
MLNLKKKFKILIINVKHTKSIALLPLQCSPSYFATLRLFALSCVSEMRPRNFICSRRGALASVDMLIWLFGFTQVTPNSNNKAVEPL